MPVSADTLPQRAEGGLARDALAAKRVELILQQLEQLPTLSSVAIRVIEAVGDEQSSIDQVVGLISSDASLTARILQLVHRADLGVRGEVSSVERAVMLLGFQAVRAAVLAITVFQAFSDPAGKTGRASLPPTQFSREEFWKHSLAVACCAELLAEKLSPAAGQEPAPAGTEWAGELSEAFVCGLLHDLGKIALYAILPKSFARVVQAADLLRGDIADLERNIIGLDHMVVGKRLAERWGLPLTIRECIWLHGQHPQALPPTVRHARLINLITLADLLVRQQHLGYSGNHTFPIAAKQLIEAVGLNAAQADQALLVLVGRIEARASVFRLEHVSSPELYQQALSRANEELGRMGSQLAAKNRRLAVRARYFDALSHFQSGLKPDSPPQAVLRAIGETAVDILGAGSAAVFSLMPQQAFADVMIFDGGGEAFETSLVDCPRRPATPTPGDGPVLAAGNDLDWLLSAISPRLAGDQRHWVCLEAEGECVGGVVWGAAAGEAQRLSPQVQELSAIAGGWGLALRTSQIREEAKLLAEQLAESNRRLQSAHGELLQSRTLISVGEMAAGAAHEMNNPLAVISGRSQLLAGQLSDPKQKVMAHLIHEQSQRLSDIITELMDYAQPVPPALTNCDAADLVAKALHEAKQHGDPADRTVEVTMGQVPQVRVDAQQVSGALAEIIENALDATDPQHGHVSIHGAFDPNSNRVAISVTDDGCGMDEHTLKHALDPFFSNKTAGRRRGLGLPKAARWIKSSGGTIRLESRVKQGSCVLVLLPAVEQEPRSREELQGIWEEND